MVSMGSIFILLIRVIRAKVFTGLVCFMFIERMPTIRYYSDFIPGLGSVVWVIRVIRVICGFYFTSGDFGLLGFLWL